MTDTLYLAWKYIQHNWIKTTVLIASISIIIFLPLGLQIVIDQGSDMLTERAASTPLLVGAKGSEVDLTLTTLYFKQPVLDQLNYRELSVVNESGLALGIPINLQYQAAGFCILGTNLDYLEYRKLSLQEGRLFSLMGECVLGSSVAKSLGLKTGEFILSTPAGAFDVAGSYPLKMKIVGILQPTDEIEDQAIFVDIKTSWVIAGLAHGHMDMTKPESESGVLKREEGKVVANASVLSYTEITDKNIDSFHFHGNTDAFPLDGIIVLPHDRKSEIILRGRYEERDDAVQILVPLHVINELLKTVASVRNYILIATIGVGIATIATAILVFVLSIRLRRREILTIRKIGGSKQRIRSILAAEISIVVVLSFFISGILTLLASRFGVEVANMLIG